MALSYAFDPSKGETPETVARRRAIAEAILQSGLGQRAPRNVGEAMHQGLSGLGEAIGYRNLMGDVEGAETAGRRSATDAFSSLFGGGGQFPAAPGAEGAAAPAGDPTQRVASAFGDMAPVREAIAGIESGGNYQAIGPTHSKLGRALGKYQVMEANVGPWSREVLGREVTPDEFLANDDIQDAIFDGKFGSYLQQYGPEGAAQAWFAGPGGVGRTERQDSLGTNVGEYGQRFMDALGGGAPTQVASADPGAAITSALTGGSAAGMGGSIPTDTMVPDQRGSMAAPGMIPEAPQQRVSQALTNLPVDPNTPIGAPVSQGGGEPGMNQIIETLGNPWLSDSQRRIGEVLLQQQMQSQDPMRQMQMERERLELEQLRNPTPKPTDDIREYEFARQQGYHGSFQEFQKDMRKAGATQVNVGPQGTDFGAPPTNHAWKRSQDGTVAVDERGAPIALPVGPALAEQEAGAAAAEAQQGVQAATDLGKADTMLSATSSIKEMMKDADMPVTGTLSRPFALYSGSPAGKVRSHVRELQSGVALNAMMRLKEASAQGATGFGAMNEKELQLLIDDVGALDPDTTDPEIFAKTIDRIESRFKRVVEDVKRNVAPERIRELGLEPLIQSLDEQGGLPEDDPLGLR